MNLQVIINSGTFRVLMDKYERMSALCDYLEQQGNAYALTIAEWGCKRSANVCYIVGTYNVEYFYSIKTLIETNINNFIEIERKLK
jgi:hypothetical protein